MKLEAWGRQHELSLSRIDHVILLLLVDDGWVWLFAGCCATCCPCVLMGRIAEIVDEGRTCKLAPMTHPHWSIWASLSMVNPQLLSIYRDQQTFSRLSFTPNCKFPRSACQIFRVGVWDLRAATSCNKHPMIDERADDNLLVWAVHAACLSAGCLFFWLLALAGSCFIYSYGYRARLREKYGLPPKPCGDCCTDYWCICCSLAQETRELQNRGVDPALGNSTKQNSPPPKQLSSFNLIVNYVLKNQICFWIQQLMIIPTF